MERRQIELFLAVAEHGSFTAAASAEHVSQPALSHAMKVLERDIGVTLFHRLPRGVRLTAAGDAFLDGARRIVRDMELARSRVHAVEGLVTGTLDLITLPGLLLEPLAGIIGRYREQHPHVLVRAHHAGDPEDIREAIASGAAELGMTNQVPPQARALRHHFVSAQEFVVLLPPGARPERDALGIQHLLDMDVVTGPVGTDVREELSRRARRVGSGFSPAVEVGHRGAALYLALVGAGVYLALVGPASPSFPVRSQNWDVPLERTSSRWHRRGRTRPTSSNAAAPCPRAPRRCWTSRWGRPTPPDGDARPGGRRRLFRPDGAGGRHSRRAPPSSPRRAGSPASRR